MHHHATADRTHTAASATAAIVAETRIGTARNDLAASYARAMRAERSGAERPDWSTIHKALASVLSKDDIRALRFRAQRIFAGLIVPAPSGHRGVSIAGARLQ